MLIDIRRLPFYNQIQQFEKIITDKKYFVHMDLKHYFTKSEAILAHYSSSYRPQAITSAAVNIIYHTSQGS